MLSSKVTTTGPFRDDILGSGTEQGTGWVIGDGVTLTAGHVVYEYNRSRTNPTIIDGSNSIFLDFEGYRARYHSAVQTHITNGTLTNSLTNAEIEGGAISSGDAVAINQGGNVDKDNAGLAWFMDAADLASVGTVLNSATITRYGNTTGNLPGSVSSVGSDMFRFSAPSNLGDSGGAYVVENTVTGKGFVFGSQVGQPALPNGQPDLSQPAYGAHLSGSDFNALMNALEGGQANGDVTNDEPTNLIAGTLSGDSPNGTYRPDIILGRGGNDTLDDGDTATDLIYANDMLFGGGGDDTLKAGKGNDLLHGGDSHDYTAAGEKNTVENDGADKLDYSQIVTRATSDKGLTVFVAPSSTTGLPAWTYGNTTDQASAIYVVDRANPSTATDYIGSDTLISIEEVSATDADDILRLDVTAGTSQQFAGIDGNLSVLRRMWLDGSTFRFATEESPVAGNLPTRLAAA